MNAIETMVTDFDSEISFGLDLFNVGLGSCSVGSSVILDVAPNNGQLILDTLDYYGPDSYTPLLLAMMNFLDPMYAPAFSSGSGVSYLVIISDGMDTCGSVGIAVDGGYDVDQELTDVTTALRDTFGIKTIAIGFGDGIDPDQLNAIAAAGGTEFTEYLDAADGDELTATLNTIAESVVVPCQFDIGSFDEEVVDLDYVNIFLNETPVPRDDGCAENEGWRWLNTERTMIEFCEQACTVIESDDVEEIRVEIACSEDDIVVI
jgi:hypothetical protein